MNKKSGRLISILSVSTVAMLMFILHFTGVFSFIENKFIDFRLSMNNDKTLNSSIMRLYTANHEQYKLEQYSDFQLKEGGTLSNKTLSGFIEFLEKANPRMILINLSIDEYNQIGSLPRKQDRNLLQTIKNYNNIVVSTTLGSEQSERFIYMPVKSVDMQPMFKIDAQSIKQEKNITGYLTNTSLYFINNKINFAIENNRHDNTVTRTVKPLYKLTYKDNDMYVPSTAFLAFLKLQNLTNDAITVNDKKIVVKNFSIATNGKNEIYLNLKRKGLYYQSFPVGALLQSYLSKSSFIEYNNKTYHLEDFKNKILILDDVPLDTTIKTLPNGENYTDAEITALELDNYLSSFKHNKNNEFLYRFSKPAPVLLGILSTFLFSILIFVGTIWFQKRFIGFLVILSYFCYPFVHYSFTKELLPVAVPLYILFVVCFFSICFIDLPQKKKAHSVASIFRHQVSKNVLCKLKNQACELSLKPEKKFITSVFFNIDNFTELSDNIESDKLVDRLNRLLEIIVTTILKYNGTVNKINSNSIIAYWGAPIGEDMAKDAMNALFAAIAVIEKIKTFPDNDDKEKNMALSLRVSIHSGDVIAGNIGTNIFSSYSAFGETIDIVRQISKIAGQFNKNLLLSLDTYELLKKSNFYNNCKKSVKFVYSGTISVKIKNVHKIALYELQEVVETSDEDE